MESEGLEAEDVEEGSGFFRGQAAVGLSAYRLFGGYVCFLHSSCFLPIHNIICTI